MRDIYHSRVPWLAALFAALWCPRYWAVTFGQTTWWTVGPDLIRDGWQRHEDCHKAQFARDGRFKFLRRYLWQWLTGIVKYRSLAQAYRNIPYEVEARKAEAAAR